MDLRLAAYELSRSHSLSPDASRRLLKLTGLETEPVQLERSFTNGLAMTAAFLGGTGVIFWIAANWSGFGRFGRFALLQGFFLAMAFGAIYVPRARAAFATVAFFAIGGVLAYFGQTYQTGADPWQLFAAWSMLALPICFATKADAVWTAWCWVTMTGISLWVAAHVGYRWRFDQVNPWFSLKAWALSAMTCALLSPLVKRVTGAGSWSFRSSFSLAAMMIAFSGLLDLSDPGSKELFVLAMAVFGGAAFMLTRPGYIDVFTLSVVGLAIDVLLIAMLANAMLNRFDILNLLLVGLLAAGILGGTVHLIVSFSRSPNRHGDPQ
jgi:uncharacterized membrane protein